MKLSNAQLKSYFLENLPAEDFEAIDLRIISDEDFSMELDNAETELLEDYIEETLSPDDKKLFETNYLISETRQNKLLFIKLIKKLAKENPQNIDLPEIPLSFFDRLKAFLSFPKVIFAGSFIILILLAGVVFQSYFDNSNDPEIAALNQRDLSNPNEFRNWTNLTLTSDNLRSGNGTNRVKSEDFTENIFIRLVIPQNFPSGAAFKVKLLRNNELIFSKNNSPIYENQFGKEFRLPVPKTKLSKGEYKIELQAENSANTILYNFTVY